MQRLERQERYVISAVKIHVFVLLQSVGLCLMLRGLVSTNQRLNRPALCRHDAEDMFATYVCKTD